MREILFFSLAEPGNVDAVTFGTVGSESLGTVFHTSASSVESNDPFYFAPSQLVVATGTVNVSMAAQLETPLPGVNFMLQNCICPTPSQPGEFKNQPFMCHNSGLVNIKDCLSPASTEHATSGPAVKRNRESSAPSVGKKTVSSEAVHFEVNSASVYPVFLKSGSANSGSVIFESVNCETVSLEATSTGPMDLKDCLGPVPSEPGVILSETVYVFFYSLWTKRTVFHLLILSREFVARGLVFLSQLLCLFVLQFLGRLWLSIPLHLSLFLRWGGLRPCWPLHPYQLLRWGQQLPSRCLNLCQPLR